jgi:hypothetical protein
MKKEKRNNCKTKACKNKCTYKYCSTCSSRKTRAKDPIRYVWLNLKNRAKQRPKEFTITLPEFRKWCIENDFFPGHGDSVDRINNQEGYHIWNIQKMPLIENIKKYHNHDKHQQYKPVIEQEF